MSSTQADFADSQAGQIENLAGAASVYTADDLNTVGVINDFLRLNDLSRSWLGKKTRISAGTVSQVLNTKYPAPPTEYLRQMMEVIRVESERMASGTPGYIEGAVHKLVFVVCDRTRKHANFGVVCGFVGVGKTRTLHEYAERKPQTMLVEANPQMTAGSLMLKLLERLNVPAPSGMDRRFDALAGALTGTNYLVIVDEAENLNSQALHYLRRLRDIARIGVVLSGTEKLAALIKPEHGQFDQIRSRVSMWPETIKGIDRDDADDMARMALGDMGDPSDEVLDALWSYGAGSARVLMESLVPALRDYARRDQPLTAKMVDAVASKVLFLTKKAKV